jgi:hypothetical protein
MAEGSSGEGKDSNMAVLAHVLGIFFGFIGPLIIYLVTPAEGYVKTQSKEALNFWITITIAYVIGGILTFILIGGLIMAAAGIYGLIMAIMAAMACSKGQDWKYPFAIRMVK